MKDPNEGCYNCGSVETYNGCRNHRIRYLCSPCVQGYALSCIKAFEDREQALKANKPRRWNRKSIKSMKLKGATLATC